MGCHVCCYAGPSGTLIPSAEFLIKCLFASRRREGVERRRQELDTEPPELDLGASPKRGRDIPPPPIADEMDSLI